MSRDLELYLKAETAGGPEKEGALLEPIVEMEKKEVSEKTICDLMVELTRGSVPKVRLSCLKPGPEKS